MTKLIFYYILRDKIKYELIVILFISVFSSINSPQNLYGLNFCTTLLGILFILYFSVMNAHKSKFLLLYQPRNVKSLRKDLGEKPFFDMHMMVAKPEQWIKPMSDSGANQYTFHLEACNDVEECIRLVKESGMKVGIGIKPATSVDYLLPFAKDVDMILIMTVEPGFGGQKFMSDMMQKVEKVRKLFPLLDIEVDGGVGPETIDCCANAGANMIVSGTSVIQALDQPSVIKMMRDTTNRAINRVM